MRIALVVDNPFRDLPGIVLVASRLCAGGATCYLVPLNLEWIELGGLAPDFALLTNLRGPKQSLARRLLNAGVKVGVLDSEGGVFPNLDTYLKMASPVPDVYGRVSCFCAWGTRLASFLTREGAYRGSQVSVTGPPRFDFYDPRWRDTALKMSSGIESYAKPIILVNGSFPRANPGFQTPDQEVESWARLGFDRDYIVRYQKVEAQAIRDLAATANHLADRFPHATVVYRPHPFERLSTYDALLDRRSNLHLSRAGTVDGWILRSSVVVHRNSTTAIEAAIAGVPVLLPAWIQPGEALPQVEGVSTWCATTDDLDARVADCLEGRRPAARASHDDVSETISDWFHRVDGAAHERVAEAVMPHLREGRADVNQNACREIHYATGPAARSRISRAGTGLRKRFGLSSAWSFTRWRECDPGDTWSRSAKYFDTASIRTVVDAIGDGAARLSVTPADAVRDYLFGYRWGHAVRMSAHAA